MKIEILEVFVVHTDAITTHTIATPTGINAIELQPITAVANRKRHRFTANSNFFSLFQHFLTKTKRCYTSTHSPAVKVRQALSRFVKAKKDSFV